MMKAEQEVSEEVKDEEVYKEPKPDDVESKPMMENEMVENEILIHEAEDKDEDEDEEKEEPSIERPYAKAEEGITPRALKSAIIFLAGRILSGPDMEDFKKLFPKLFV